MEGYEPTIYEPDKCQLTLLHVRIFQLYRLIDKIPSLLFVNRWTITACLYQHLIQL